MARRYQPRESELKAKARRALALGRSALRQESSERESAVGPTSHAVKARDPDSERAVAEFLARRGAGQ